MKFLPEGATGVASVRDCAALHFDVGACFLPLLEG